MIPPTRLPFSRDAAGVLRTGSSTSRSMAISSSEDEFVSESESNMLILLTELEMVVLSGTVVQSELWVLLGESRTVDPPMLRLWGI